MYVNGKFEKLSDFFFCRNCTTTTTLVLLWCIVGKPPSRSPGTPANPRGLSESWPRSRPEFKAKFRQKWCLYYTYVRNNNNNKHTSSCVRCRCIYMRVRTWLHAVKETGSDRGTAPKTPSPHEECESGVRRTTGRHAYSRYIIYAHPKEHRPRRKRQKQERPGEPKRDTERKRRGPTERASGKYPPAFYQPAVSLYSGPPLKYLYTYTCAGMFVCAFAEGYPRAVRSSKPCVYIHMSITVIRRIRAHYSRGNYTHFGGMNGRAGGALNNGGMRNDDRVGCVLIRISNNDLQRYTRGSRKFLP